MAEFIYGIHGSEEFQTFIFEIAFVDEPDRFLKRRRIDIGMKDDIPVSGAAPADLQGNRSIIRRGMNLSPSLFAEARISNVKPASLSI